MGRPGLDPGTLGLKGQLRGSMRVSPSPTASHFSLLARCGIVRGDDAGRTQTRREVTYGPRPVVLRTLRSPTDEDPVEWVERGQNDPRALWKLPIE